MGVSDPLFENRFDTHIKTVIQGTNKPINKIAWLGASSINSVGPKTFEQIYIDNGGDPDKLEMDYFDINVKEDGKYWDINSSWDVISGYDLVIAWRVSPFCKDADHFSEQLSKILDKNGSVIFDFFVGGPTIIPAMLPFFVRNVLSDAFKTSIEDVSAIFSWDDLFFQTDKRRYENFFLLPQFNNLYNKYSTVFKLEVGYDIRRSLPVSPYRNCILTDKKLSEHGVRVSLENYFSVTELHNVYSLQEPHEGLDILYPLYGTEITKNMSKHIEKKINLSSLKKDSVYRWFQPLSPFIPNSDSGMMNLPTKQLHLIVQFENING